MFFWAWAVGYDLLGLYKRVAKKPLGKAFFPLLLSLATHFAIMMASHVVNNVVGIDPTKFSHAIALLSILSIPVFVAAGLTLIYAALIIVSPALLMFHMFPDEVKKALIPGYTPPESYPYRKTTLLIQLLSVAMFTSFAGSMIAKFAKTYDDALMHTAREFIFELEMYPRARCAIPKGSHVAFVADEKIMTAERAASGNGTPSTSPATAKPAHRTPAMTNSPSHAVGVRSPAPRQAVLDRIDEFQAAIEGDLDALSASWNDQARSAGINPTPWLLAGVVLARTLAAVLFSFAR